MQNDLRVRLRNFLDKDIKQGIEKLGPLEQGELSELIRLGMRKVLQEKGAISDKKSYSTQKDTAALENLK